ncbi:MAG: DNA cytosine methyltransferase [Promethearchaeati archaeon SRVP18_Atabeyarchaeia-1]
MPYEDVAITDLFAGPGGLSLGFREAGFRIVAAVERDVPSAQTYKLNFPEVRLLGDAENVHGADLVDISASAGFDRLFLVGGPPCQPYSPANTHKNNGDRHPCASSVSHFVRIVQETKPEGFLFENVVRFQRMNTWETFVNALSNVGYTLSFSHLDARTFGVPQIRRRLFVAGFKNGVKFDFSLLGHREPTHVGEAICGLPRLPEGGGGKDDAVHPMKNGSLYVERLLEGATKLYNHRSTVHSSEVVDTIRLIKQGESLRRSWKRLPEDIKGRYSNLEALHSNIYRRLCRWRASPTIVHARRAMLLHPGQHRILSVREAARLQGFPDRFRFMGSLNDQYQQVANAVPPLVAEAVAHLIRRLLDGRGGGVL